LIEKKDNAVVYFLVNDYLEENSFIYFSYIDGGLRDDFCYYNPNLKLAKINKTTHKMEDISIESNKRIFELLNKIEPSDKKWLSQKSNLCASPKNK
jgi:identified by metaGeneAnnotator